jgi:hypothetical protein
VPQQYPGLVELVVEAQSPAEVQDGTVVLQRQQRRRRQQQQQKSGKQEGVRAGAAVQAPVAQM